MTRAWRFQEPHATLGQERPPRLMVNAGFTERLLARGATLPPNDVRNGAFSARRLGYAAASYGLPLARTLLELGGDPNRKGSRGVTPLMMAAAATDPDPVLVQLLLDKGADVAARDNNGRTALVRTVPRVRLPVLLRNRVPSGHESVHLRGRNRVGGDRAGVCDVGARRTSSRHCRTASHGTRGRHLQSRPTPNTDRERRR